MELAGDQSRVRRLQIAEALVVASYFQVVQYVATFIPHQNFGAPYQNFGAPSPIYDIGSQIARELVLTYLLYASRDLAPIFRVNRGNYSVVLLASLVGMSLPFVFRHGYLFPLTAVFMHMTPDQSRLFGPMPSLLERGAFVLLFLNREMLGALFLLRLGGSKRFSVLALVAQAAVFQWQLLFPSWDSISYKFESVAVVLILAILFQWSRSLWPAILSILTTILWAAIPFLNR